MFMIYLIIIIKSEVSTFPIFVILSRGCVPVVVVPSYAVCFICMHNSRENWVFCLLLQSYDMRRKIILWPDGRIRLFAHHPSSLSSLCRPTWKYWTSCKAHSVSNVCLRLCQFYQLSFMRIQLTHFSYDDYENICILSYYHYQIRNMTHLSLFRVRSWNNGSCCMYFIFLLTHDRRLLTIISCLTFPNSTASPVYIEKANKRHGIGYQFALVFCDIFCG